MSATAPLDVEHDVEPEITLIDDAVVGDTVVRDTMVRDTVVVETAVDNSGSAPRPVAGDLLTDPAMVVVYLGLVSLVLILVASALIAF